MKLMGLEWLSCVFMRYVYDEGVLVRHMVWPDGRTICSHTNFGVPAEPKWQAYFEKYIPKSRCIRCVREYDRCKRNNFGY